MHIILHYYITYCHTVYFLRYVKLYTCTYLKNTVVCLSHIAHWLKISEIIIFLFLVLFMYFCTILCKKLFCPFDQMGLKCDIENHNPLTRQRKSSWLCIVGCSNCTVCCIFAYYAQYAYCMFKKKTVSTVWVVTHKLPDVSSQEQAPPCLDDFLYICDDAYKRSQLITMEISILQALNFDINIPVPYRFLRRYAKVRDNTRIYPHWRDRWSSFTVSWHTHTH